MIFRRQRVFYIFSFLFCLFFFGFAIIVYAQTANKVKVISIYNDQYVNFEDISSDVKKISTASSCRTESPERYEFEKRDKKRVACLSGLTESRLLGEKISDLDESISLINQRLTSLKNTEIYLNTKNDINGISLVAVPVGSLDNNKKHDTATNIRISCLKDGNSKILEVEVAIGNRAVSFMTTFKPVSQTQIDTLEKVKKENREIETKIQDDGEMSAGTITSLANQALELKKIMAERFIPITVLDASDDYWALINSGHTMSLQISHSLNDNGAKKTHEIPTAFKLLAFMAGVVGGDMLVEANLVMDRVTLSPTWLPEKTMLKEFRESVVLHRKRFNDMKADQETLKAKLEKRLKDLQEVGFNCT